MHSRRASGLRADDALGVSIRRRTHHPLVGTQHQFLARGDSQISRLGRLVHLTCHRPGDWAFPARPVAVGGAPTIALCATVSAQYDASACTAPRRVERPVRRFQAPIRTPLQEGEIIPKFIQFNMHTYFSELRALQQLIRRPARKTKETSARVGRRLAAQPCRPAASSPARQTATSATSIRAARLA